MLSTCVFLYFLISWSAATIQEGMAVKNFNLQDSVFDSDLLFEVTAKSKLDCALMCAQMPGSGTFTFSRNSALCRCHDSALSASSNASSSPAPGTEVFQLRMPDWLLKPCSGNGDCQAEGAECITGKCLCAPTASLYYSVSKNRCVPTCPEENLLNTDLILYNGMGLLWPADMSELWQNHELGSSKCADDCADMPRCRIAVYEEGPGRCFEVHPTANHTAPTILLSQNCYSHVKRCM